MNRNELVDRLTTVAEAIRSLPENLPDIMSLFVRKNTVGLNVDYPVYEGGRGTIRQISALATAVNAPVEIRRRPYGTGRQVVVTFTHNDVDFDADDSINITDARRIAAALNRKLPVKDTLTLTAAEFATAIDKAWSA